MVVEYMEDHTDRRIRKRKDGEPLNLSALFGRSDTDGD
jgi:hypothetical protein